MPTVHKYFISPNLLYANFTFDADILEASSERSGVFHIDSRIKTEHVSWKITWFHIIVLTFYLLSLVRI